MATSKSITQVYPTMTTPSFTEIEINDMIKANSEISGELRMKKTFTIGEINAMLRVEATKNGEIKYKQFRWNKFEQKYVTRNTFTLDYLKQFAVIISHFSYRSWNLPEVTNFFAEAANEEYSSEIETRWDSKTREDYEFSLEKFKKKLRWGVTLKFPNKNFTYGNGFMADINYYFVYSYFENGEGGYDFSFIEYSSCEDTFYGEFYETFFHRAYVSLDEVIYPFFKWPEGNYIVLSKSTNILQPSGIEYSVIKYLKKELGAFASVVDKGNVCYYKDKEPILSNKSVEYYESGYYAQLRKEYYAFTIAEARQLNPRWEDECDYYGDY